MSVLNSKAIKLKTNAISLFRTVGYLTRALFYAPSTTIDGLKSIIARRIHDWKDHKIGGYREALRNLDFDRTDAIWPSADNEKLYTEYEAHVGIDTLREAVDSPHKKNR